MWSRCAWVRTTQLNRRWNNGKRLPVAFSQLLLALKEAAVDHEALACGLHDILGSCYRSGCTEKLNCGHEFLDDNRFLYSPNTCAE